MKKGAPFFGAMIELGAPEVRRMSFGVAISTVNNQRLKGASCCYSCHCYQPQEGWSQYQAPKAASCCWGYYQLPKVVSCSCQATRASINRRRLSLVSLDAITVKTTSMSHQDCRRTMPLGSHVPQQSSKGVWELSPTTSSCYCWSSQPEGFWELPL